MKPDDLAMLREEIEHAHAMAERGHHHIAAQLFASARAMCVPLADVDALTTRLDANRAALIRTREKYRALIASRFRSGRGLVVLSDSLGLPRPDDTSGEYDGAERTYPFLLGEHFGDRAVHSYCQPYSTTSEVLDMVLTTPELGRDSDVVIHVGLNDCANRMFSEPDRLSLDLLPGGLKARIVGFVQKYRKLVLQELPAYHYVAPEQFSANLDTILALLNARGARVVVTTIILPLVRFWPATPGMQRNFADYNLRVMDAAARHHATVLHMDRLVWDQQHTGVLLPDGMHLSLKGHELFTRFAAGLLP